MRPVRDLTSQRYGMLVATRLAGKKATGHAIWLWRCDCGNEKEIPGADVVNKARGTRSCGCMRAAKARAQMTTHGMTDSPTFKSWRSMRNRCLNPNSRGYDKYYGGAGVTVCERWAEFRNFLADMGERPSPSHTIDRIDWAGNYEPENCRWATPKEQARNKRSNVKAMFRGESRTISEIVEITGVSRKMIDRLHAEGRDLEKCISPLPAPRMIYVERGKQ